MLCFASELINQRSCSSHTHIVSCRHVLHVCITSTWVITAWMYNDMCVCVCVFHDVASYHTHVLHACCRHHCVVTVVVVALLCAHQLEHLAKQHNMQTLIVLSTINMRCRCVCDNELCEDLLVHTTVYWSVCCEIRCCELAMYVISHVNIVDDHVWASNTMMFTPMC